ncbi:MAG: DUF1924 domain-containing protein [Burkholderiaceae bacterium]|nr:DUF1924 domain-containing protein [Burkholderiaceae bacterium]
MRNPRQLAGISILLLGVITATPAFSETSARSQLNDLEASGQIKSNAEDGRIFFTSTHANDWSCASCHRAPPTSDGEHASTGKRIAPLAPAFNADAFTNQRRTDKWFRRNCKDVLDRTCTDQEKANVLAYLLSLTLNNASWSNK